MLGIRIKTYMEDQGIKQTFLSDKTGISLPVIDSMLNGDRKIEANEYYLICKALGKSLEFFFVQEKQTYV